MSTTRRDARAEVTDPQPEISEDRRRVERDSLYKNLRALCRVPSAGTESELDVLLRERLVTDDERFTGPGRLLLERALEDTPTRYHTTYLANVVDGMLFIRAGGNAEALTGEYDPDRPDPGTGERRTALEILVDRLVEDFRTTARALPDGTVGRDDPDDRALDWVDAVAFLSLSCAAGNDPFPRTRTKKRLSGLIEQRQKNVAVLLTWFTGPARRKARELGLADADAEDALNSALFTTGARGRFSGVYPQAFEDTPELRSLARHRIKSALYRTYERTQRTDGDGPGVRLAIDGDEDPTRRTWTVVDLEAARYEPPVTTDAASIAKMAPEAVGCLSRVTVRIATAPSGVLPTGTGSSDRLLRWLVGAVAANPAFDPVVPRTGIRHEGRAQGSIGVVDEVDVVGAWISVFATLETARGTDPRIARADALSVVAQWMASVNETCMDGKLDRSAHDAVMMEKLIESGPMDIVRTIIDPVRMNHARVTERLTAGLRDAGGGFGVGVPARLRKQKSRIIREHSFDALVEHLTGGYDRQETDHG